SDVCSSDLWDRAAVERRRRRGRRAPARRRTGTNRTRQNGPPSRPEAPQEAPRPRTEKPGTSSCRSSWRPPCRVTVVASRIDEVGPEQVASSVKSRHDSTDGPVDDRGDGAVRQPLDVSQLHDFPHEGRQAADTFPDPFDGLLAKENVLGSERNREEGTLEQPGRLRVDQRILEGRRLPAPLPVDMGISDDGEYPGLERQVANERVEAVEGLEQALLEQILVVLGGPGQEHRVVV